MPITFEYDEENNILYETGEGEISLEEFREFRTKIVTIVPADGLRVLADYRYARIHFTYNNLGAMKIMTQKMMELSNGIVAAICVKDDAGFGLARMYAISNDSESYKAEVFRDIDEAKQWLGIPDEG